MMIDIDTRYRTTIVVSRLPLPHELDGSGWVWGSVSVSHPHRRVRYSLASHTFRVGDGLVTSRELARWWVETYYDPRRLRRRSLPDPHHIWAAVPLLARIGQYDEAYYVDIRALHREIIARVGYDVEYAGVGTYISLQPIQVLLPKQAYLSLSSLSISHRLLLRKWNNGRIVCIETRNRFANSSLYRLIRDVQRAIAEDVVANVPSVMYYNTDGAIVTRWDDVERVCEIVASWGLEARIKYEGRCWVAGIASYSFTERNIKQRLPYRPWEFVFTPRHREWLRTRLNAAAAREPRKTLDLSGLQSVSTQSAESV